MIIEFNEERLHLECIKNYDTIEFTVRKNGNIINGFISRGSHYNWLALPIIGVACQLSSFEDSYWNGEQVYRLLDNPFDAEVITFIIPIVGSMFNKESQDHFDGKQFLSLREYIFWLENECEALSNQICKLEVKLDNFDSKDLLYDSEQYHITMREQYDVDIF